MHYRKYLIDQFNCALISTVLSSKAMPSTVNERVATDPANGFASLSSNEGIVREPILHRLQHLGLVLFVSLAMPIVGSCYILLGGTAPTDPMQQKLRLFSALITETISLVVLAYVMRSQGKTWEAIGWKPEFFDVARAIGLFILINVVTYLIFLTVNYASWKYVGHRLTPKSLRNLFGFGISFLSIAFICLNPFFEELIVRAYVMSEMLDMGARHWTAIVVSVALQMSYHLYQGPVNALALTIVFTGFSIYYARRRRIMPVILAHLFFDLLVLIQGAF